MLGKKRVSGQACPGLFPTPLSIGVPDLVPDGFEYVGRLPVDAPVYEYATISDPLLNLVDIGSDNYVKTYWGDEAYKNMFAKFTYRDPDSNIAKNYKKLWSIASSVLAAEYDYLHGSHVLPVSATLKNIDSTPAYPLREEYKSERDFVNDRGLSPYRYAFENCHTFGDCRILWWCFLKNEILKREKVEQQDIRMIMCSHPCYARIGSCFEDVQNARMKAHCYTREGKVGWNPFGGMIDKLFRRLCKFDYLVELDWTRFDGTIPPEVFYHIKMYRFSCLRDSDKTDENFRRYCWYVSNLIYKLCLLPNGEVCLIDKGNPSGQISTTTDNIMVNTFLTAFELSFLYYHCYAAYPSADEIRSMYLSYCYGDDRVVGVRDVDYYPLCVIEMYAHVFGMWVKEEKIKVFGSPDGVSFCGFTMHLINGRYCPVPNVEKLFASFSSPVKKLKDIFSLWAKLVSIRILCYYDASAFQRLGICLEKVEGYMARIGLEAPVLPSNFYKLLWEGPE